MFGLGSVGSDEDVDPGQEGGDRPLAEQLHLYVQKEVFRLPDGSLEVEDSRVRVEFPDAEIILLVALFDVHEDVVTRVGWRRGDPEDLCRDHHTSGEIEAVVGDPHRRVLTVLIVEALDPLTFHV